MARAIATSVTEELRNAIRLGLYERACEHAKSMPRVELVDALWLTMLAAEKDPERYGAIARRFMARLLEERELTVDEMADASEMLRRADGTGLAQLMRDTER